MQPASRCALASTVSPKHVCQLVRAVNAMVTNESYDAATLQDTCALAVTRLRISLLVGTKLSYNRLIEDRAWKVSKDRRVARPPE